MTPRDIYRFDAISALLTAIDKAGGKVVEALVAGKRKFEIAGEEVECVCAEKMVRPLKRPEGDAAKWTALPHYRQTGLSPSGFLRVQITTWLRGNQPSWIEKEKKRFGQLLPKFVAAIMRAGPVRAEIWREKQEAERRRHQEEMERYERRRLKEIDDRRWSRFREMAVN